MRKLLNWFWLRFAPKKLLKRLKSKLARRIYFVREYEATYRQIWKYEFKLRHFRDVREDIRREYDKAKEDVEALKIRLELEDKKEDRNNALADSLRKANEGKETDIRNFKEQIDGMDKEIKQSEEIIASLREVLPLVESLINE